MGLSGAVQWWEEWQLRILVLGSLAIQCYLAFFASARKKHIKPLFRFSIWLAYLGGDAIAIYALATLFNRQWKVWYTSADSSHDLEVLWAPILLMHLGGRINISAYNIEDNELWMRHVVTAVSQVAVALYVFCKSWSPSADKRLLTAAILLFILGVFKCFERPLALKRSSFNSLVSSVYPVPRAKNINREVELEQYIQEARDFVNLNRDPLTLTLDDHTRLLHSEKLSIPDNLFVDTAYDYHDRLTKLKSFCMLNNKTVYVALRKGLSETFDRIYSKQPQEWDDNRQIMKIDYWCSLLLWFFTMTLPIVPIILFHISHKESFTSSDIKVTFSLLYITYLLEISTFASLANYFNEWNDLVAQNSVIGFLARNRRNPWLMGVAESKPCYSSKDITGLVQDHVRNGWINYISDIESYWKFSDVRGHWTLERNGCEENLGESIEKPFDESIILWHVATYFCLHHKGMSPKSETTRLCREISNYMVHLLFANPEMLIPGSRRTLFTDACNELEALLKDEDISLLDEKQLTEKIIDKVGTSEEGNIVHGSWVLAQKLMGLGEEKMWEVIEGVWIEMLCFSAGRCRGYLHAKSLGSGGEYLTFVSILMSHAGLETFAERQQRVTLRLPKEERVKIAKQRIQEAARDQATDPLTTSQGTVPVNEEENAAITSASQGECIAPANSPEIKIVVSL